MSQLTDWDDDGADAADVVVVTVQRLRHED